MAKRKIKRENVGCRNCSTFVKILLIILAILVVIALLYSSGLIGKAVYSPCVDSDNTRVSSFGVVETDDASIFVKGSVTQGYTTTSDLCEGFRVIEYFCDNGHRDSRAMYCDNGCSNGACKK